MQTKIPELKWEQQPKFIYTRKCSLEAKILLNIPENSNPLKTYKATTDFSEHVQYICEQTNIYTTQKGRICYKSWRNLCFFRQKLYHVYFKATKFEMLLYCWQLLLQLRCRECIDKRSSHKYSSEHSLCCQRNSW